MLYEKLNYVLTIAEEQNLTRAAKRLFISQPTLTLYLNRLEAELGAKLFDRTKSPITLTEAGRFYIENMKKIAASEQLVRNDIKLLANPDQTLVIGIGQVRGHHWLPAILPNFCAMHPGINIQIQQSAEQQMNDALTNGKIDVAFGVLPASSVQLEVVDLIYESLFLVAHKSFGLIPAFIRTKFDADNPYPVEPQKLDGLPFIAPQVSNGLYDSYEKLILKSGIHPSRTISINNLNTGFQLVRRGLGVQLLSGSLLQVDEEYKLDLHDLDFCILEDMPSSRKCVAAYQPDNAKAKLIRDLLQIIQETLLPECQHVLPIMD